MGRSIPPSARALTALSLFARLGTLTAAAEQLALPARRCRTGLPNWKSASAWHWCEKSAGGFR